MGVTAECITRSVVGSFEDSPVLLLGKILSEANKVTRREKLIEHGIYDDSFIDALEKSYGHCRRGILLYPERRELAVSFNGGKDACVVLYLWLATMEALRITSQLPKSESSRQPIIFFDSSDEFEEVREFVMWVTGSLDLGMMKLEGQSFRNGMVGLVDEGLRAVVMGQRRGDPWMADVDVFSPSTEGWPAFMRINPIIEWSYGHVWTFLRGFGLPYCALYNDGYTSLGSVASTFRNPALRRPDGSYAAAYQLVDGEQERDGRGSRQVTTEPSQALAEPVCSAGIVVVGDEILNGKVRDCNAHYLCGMLHSRGINIKGIEVVPDDIDAIASAVRKLSMSCDFVFTSGGLGPTHDDVTMAGVAAAFKCRLIQDDKFFAMLSSQDCGRRSDAFCRKMATMPEGSTVEWPSDGNAWPIVSVQNVYIFAGMPCVCRQMFERAASDGRFTGSQKFACVALHLNAEEHDILDALQNTVDAFPDVHIGSYPSSDVPSGEAGDACSTSSSGACPGKLTITFEAFDAKCIEAARDHFRKALPDEAVIVAEESGCESKS